MKKLSISALALSTALGASAQYVLPSQSVNVTSYGHRTNHDRSYQTKTYDPITGDQIWIDAPDGTGVLIYTGGDLWNNGGATGLTNYYTTSGGSTDIMRGDATSDVTIGIYHNLNGMIYAVNGAASGNSTKIISEDDVTIEAAAFSTVYTEYNNAITVDGSSGSFELIEGQYSGYSGYSAAFFRSATSLDIQGSSFVAGNYGIYTESRSPEGYDQSTASANSMSYAASGLYVDSMSGALTISNRTGRASDRFEGAAFNSYTTEDANTYIAPYYSTSKTRWIIGGDGLTATAVTGKTTIYGGNFIGSTGDRTITFTDDYTEDADINVSGGNGASLTGSGAVAISGGRFYGGQAGTGVAGGSGAEVTANAGHGIYLSGKGATTISDAEFYAGKAGIAKIQRGYVDGGETTDEDGTASAIGGNGIRLSSVGTTVISNVTATATKGGTARGSDTANASGGAGIYISSTDTTINGGKFTGGNGGITIGDGDTYAYGGAGAYVSGDSLTINAGTFKGGKAGTADNASGGIGVWANNADLTVTDNEGDTTIYGDVLFYNTSDADLAIEGGTITGDILVYGSGKATVSVEKGADYSGSFILGEGDADVNINEESQGKFFSNVRIGSESSMSFVGTNRLVTAKDSNFKLVGSGSTIDFTQGAYLKSGTTIDAGSGTVSASAPIEMAGNSAIYFSYGTSFDSNGVSSISGGSLTGDLVISNTSAKVKASGIAANYSEIIQLTTGSIDAGTNSLDKVVNADFGFLTQPTITDNGGVEISLSYKPLNETFKDINAGYLSHYDAVIQTNLTEKQFYELNAGGSESLRFGISQMPDVSESSFKISQEVNKQLAARGTEFRSMNSFASSKSVNGSPVGVAGPDGEKEKTMQGWIRAYGGKGSRDSSGSFSDYDSTFWGTVVGIDKSFGNLLLGLAGGYSNSDIDGSYDADVETYHGSLYSTFGGESLYIDAALTFGWNSTEEKSSANEAKFDSQTYSAYIGAGYAFDIGQKITLTPAASLLASFYQQDEYDRSGTFEGTVGEYDTSSFLGSVGVSLATQHQLDWLNRGIAFIPEVRAHYVHEFNADPEDFSYTAGGNTATFAVRPRDESMFRLGLGIDMWNWRYQNTKFEIDYDGLFSDTYGEHVVSGKITYRF